MSGDKTDVPGSTGRSIHLPRSWERYAGLFVLIGAALLCLPFSNIVWMLSDEGVWLHAAQRMMRGEILYRDFFEIHPPLGFFVVHGWLSLFGPTLLAARLLIVAVVAITAWLAFACCRTISGRTGLSAFLALLWVASSQGVWTQVNHHWLTSLFSMLALWALMPPDGRPVRSVVAGAAASAATLVTTHRGALIVLAGFATLLARKSRKALAGFIGGGLAFLAGILGLLWWQGSLQAAFEQAVLHAIRNYSDIQGVFFGAFVTPQTAVAVAAYPVTAILLVLAVRRAGFAILRQPHWATASLFALSGFLGCFPRPDAIHISINAVLALPLLAGLISVLLQTERTSILMKAVAAAAGVLALSPLLVTAMEAGRASRVETAAGRVAMPPGNGAPKLIERLGQIPAGDSVFVYPYDPMLPFLTGRTHPARLDILVPQYSPPSQYRETCIEVMRSAQWVIVNMAVLTPAFYAKVFPAMDNPSPPEKQSFEAALEQGFAEDARYGDFQLRRRADANDGLCQAIGAVAR